MILSFILIILYSMKLESIEDMLNSEWIPSLCDECPNIAHTDDEESDGLHKEKDEVMVIPK